MKQKSTAFNYRTSTKIVQWGCRFDSITEFKYAVSIMDDYEFLRARISIYYHPGTKLPTDYIRKFHRRFTPDFLVRHKTTGKALLVEIKPRAFENDPQLLIRKQVAENYIRWKKYDWTYKVIFDDEILLTEEQWKEFEDCCKQKTLSARKIWLEQYNKKLDRINPAVLKSAPTNSQITFVMFGLAGEK